MHICTSLPHLKTFQESTPHLTKSLELAEESVVVDLNNPISVLIFPSSVHVKVLLVLSAKFSEYSTTATSFEKYK